MNKENVGASGKEDQWQKSLYYSSNLYGFSCLRINKTAEFFIDKICYKAGIVWSEKGIIIRPKYWGFGR